MKKVIILSIAAVAVLFVSLALNINVNTSTSNVNLGQLMQSANADAVYWAHTYCADPFGSNNFSNADAIWQNGQLIDCPFDNKAYRVRVCYAGGGAVCSLDETQSVTSTTWVSTGEGSGYYTTTTSTQALGQRWNVGNWQNIHKVGTANSWDPSINPDYQISGVNHLLSTPWDRDFNTTVGFTGYDPQYQ